MGALTVSDEQLRATGVEILESIGSDIRGLRIPEIALESYMDLVRSKLQPGFWNEVVGRTTVIFIFKMNDRTVKQLVYSPDSREEISRLCSEMNDDPIEKTSNPLRYLASNGFYRETMVECYGVALE